MPTDRTQTQAAAEYEQAQQLSLARVRPPAEVPGYEIQRFLGAGAYGEVWVAVDRKTGRQVAIKFYTHRGGLDWSLLSREVEKLVFLSADRYVVQLLDVGWDAQPPYYVMEYVENGSLDDRLKRSGRLPVREAVAMFREVAIGLVHAHGRGVLHCDLKPANILLDQDQKPRLADFGQSRLSDEQDPALGTLFYMAPEQADLKALPDARWDVYALGALLYSMLTGAAPYRDEQALAEMESATELDERLLRYRRWIAQAPPPAAHRGIRGVDRLLADIIDRCLETNPVRRYPNVQAVIEALDAREARRARRPLMVLGMIGPLLLVTVMALAMLGGLDTVMRQSDQALTDRALESNHFAARYVARAVSNELTLRYQAVEQMASSPRLQELLEELLQNSELAELRQKLNDPNLDEATQTDLREQFVDHPARRALQQWLQEWDAQVTDVEGASWFVNDPQGLQLGRAPTGRTIGLNYAWRTYFHGGPQDQSFTWRPAPGQHVKQTSLSAVFLSQATDRWIAGISTPVYKGGPGGEFLGIVALTVEVGRFVELQGSAGQLAVLVDLREGDNKGLVLQHPLFQRYMSQGQKLPEQFRTHRISPQALPDGERHRKADYRDPMAEHQEGEAYAGRWLADVVPVTIRGQESGLQVIVQETHDHAIGPTLRRLESSLLWIGGIALAVVAGVLTLLWSFVVRGMGESDRRDYGSESEPLAPSTDLMGTIADRNR